MNVKWRDKGCVLAHIKCKRDGRYGEGQCDCDRFGFNDKTLSIASTVVGDLLVAADTRKARE